MCRLVSTLVPTMEVPHSSVAPILRPHWLKLYLHWTRTWGALIQISILHLLMKTRIIPKKKRARYKVDSKLSIDSI